MNLVEALTAARRDGALVPQVQGDCGIFAFWYATVLLRYCGDGRPPVYPRKHERPGVSWRDGGHPETSIREWAKQNLHSGQGEILTTREMKELMIAHGYAPVDFPEPGELAVFVGQGHPVLVCYAIGPGGRPDPKPTGPHAHWSLVVSAAGTSCLVVNPHDPRQDHWWSLAELLAGNRAVDDYAYERTWFKLADRPLVSETTLRGLLHLGNADPIPESAYVKRYDIGQEGRSQALRGAILGVV